MKNPNLFFFLFCISSAIGFKILSNETNSECSNPNNGIGPYYPPNPMGLPFYGAKPIINPELANSNLTYNPSNGKKALGEIVKLGGRITNMNHFPLSKASVELWNTNSYGSYVVENSPRGIDKGFIGYGKVKTNENGEFEFITIKPIAYTRYGFLINRPPHFHFLVTHSKIKPLGLEVDIIENPDLINPCENKIYLEDTGSTEIKYHGIFNIKVKEIES